MPSRRHSRNWIQSRSSRPQPSWANSWKLDSRSRSELTAVPAGRRCVLLYIDSQVCLEGCASPARLVSQKPFWMTSCFADNFSTIVNIGHHNWVYQYRSPTLIISELSVSTSVIRPRPTR
jgi:hypothetical protein